MSMRVWLRPAMAAALLLAAIAARGDDAPTAAGNASDGAPLEIIRARVAGDAAFGLFPPGTELRGLGFEEFEGLVARARAGSRRVTSRRGARLVRARHFAVWRDDVLTGRSELRVEPGSESPGDVAIDPWTPSLEARAAGERTLVASDASGRLLLRFAGREAFETALGWRQHGYAEAGSGVRTVRLGLPACTPSVLFLDLPAGWVPEAEGRPVEREPSTEPAVAGDVGPAAGWTRWRMDGAGGMIALRLRSRNGATARSAVEPRPWTVGGTTRIDVDGATARWTAVWRVEREESGSTRFGIELDPGIELLEASGPDVESFQLEPSEGAGKAGRAAVTFRSTSAVASELTLRGTAVVVDEGEWRIPSARPTGGVWSGGTTRVRIGSGRVVRECRPIGGRLLADSTARTPASVADDRAEFVFDAPAPRSPAVLVFRKPWVDATVEVRGQLLLGNAAPRLECQLNWLPRRGRPLELDFELPPSWTADRVEIVGRGEPIGWHPEPLAGGATRIRAAAPSDETRRGPIVVRVAATSSLPGGQGPLALPRVRPTSARVADELWLSWTEPDLLIEPIEARGLAWIDPALVLGATAAAKSLGEPALDASMPRQALAWRWIEPRGEARIDRRRIAADEPGRIEMRAVARSDRLALDWRIDVDLGERLTRGVTLVATSDLAAGSSPRAVDEETGETLSVRRVAAPPAAGDDGAAASARQSWRVEFPEPRQGRVVIRIDQDRAWSASVAPPLLAFAAPRRVFGAILVGQGAGVRVSSRCAGGSRLDAGVLERRLSTWGTTASAAPSASTRWTDAYVYQSADATLALDIEVPAAETGDGIIQEAVLQTAIEPETNATARRHHLALTVATVAASTLEFELPAGSTLARCRVDGRPATPVRRGDGLAIALPATRPNRPGAIEVALDYLTLPATATPASATLIQPETPRFSWPCTSFRWELVVPRDYDVEPAGNAWTSADPAPIATARDALLDPWRRLWTRSSRDLDNRAEEATSHSATPENTTLGEYLALRDGGARPVVIDRVALSAAGWGPRSRGPRDGRGATSGPTAEDPLAALGLSATPIAGAVLVTTIEETPARPDRAFDDDATRRGWERAVRAAVAYGADDADRLQSFERWRREPTPRAVAEPSDIRAGHVVRRFVANGLPASGTAVRLVDRRAVGSARWACACAVLALGCAFRRRALALRLGLVAAVVAVAGLMFVPAFARGLGFAAAGLAAGLAVVIVWLRDARRAPFESSTSSSPSSRSTTPRTRAAGFGSTVTPIALAAFTIPALAATRPGRADAPQATARQAPNAPTERTHAIIALEVFDGPPDPAARPSRVWLRLDDYRRLARLAEGKRPSADDAAFPALRLASARHDVVWTEPRQARVASTLDLVNLAAATSSWELPIAGSFDLSATVDGRPTALRVRPGGKTASVEIAGAGAHRVVLERSVETKSSADGRALRLPVNPSSTAAVVVAAIPGARDVELVGPDATSIRSAGDPPWTLPLGAIALVELRRRTDEPGARPARVGSVEGLMLWDAESAGDRLRARLTCRAPGGIRALRIAIDPGARVRAPMLAGLVEARLDATGDRPVWLGRFEPPLPDGAVVNLDVFRPIANPSVAAAAANAAAVTPDPEAISDRKPPEFDPIDFETFSANLALRRPADWTGRLPRAADAIDAMTEEAFVRAWGELPVEPLTLSGVARVARQTGPAVALGPRPSAPRLTTSVEYRIGAGLVEAIFEIEAFDPARPVRELTFDLANAPRVVAVVAPDLTSWDQPNPAALRLRFDAASARTRRLRVQLAVPAHRDPLANAAAASAEFALPAPWLRDPHAAATIAEVTLRAASKAWFDDGPGITRLAAPSATNPIATAPRSDADAPQAVVAAYRVALPEGPGTLHWRPEPPRLGVLTRSQLTLLPRNALWSSILDVAAKGGPIDVVHARIPTEWAAAVHVRVVGDDARVTTQQRGTLTYLSIYPQNPIWGGRRILLRADRRLEAARAVDFPRLEPLGQGSVDAYLAVASAGGREPRLEASSGLEPSAEAARFAAADFQIPPGVPTQVFHVLRDDWNLRVQGPGDLDSAGDSDSPRVLDVDVEMTLAPDRSILGRARGRVVARGAAYLAVDLPPHAVPIWLVVGSTPTRLLVAPNGRRLVPLGPEPATKIDLLWRVDATHVFDHGQGTARLPRLLGPAAAVTLAAWRIDDAFRVEPRTPSLETSTWERLAFERARRVARRIETALDLPRNAGSKSVAITPEARAALDAELTEFNLLARSAARAAEWSTPPGAGDLADIPAGRRAVARIEALRSRLADQLEAAQLAGPARDLRNGLPPTLGTADDPSESRLRDAPAEFRLHAAGAPLAFLATELAGGSATDATPWWSLSANPEAPAQSMSNLAAPPTASVVAMSAALLLCLVPLALADRSRAARRAARLLAAAGLALGLGPAGAALGVALVATSSRSRKNKPSTRSGILVDGRKRLNESHSPA